jgi:hypothetical protein
MLGTLVSHKRPLTARETAIGCGVYAACAVYLFATDRWPVLAWILLVSALINGIPAIWEVFRGTRR